MWRRVVGGVGRSLIGLGVLLLLFIAYQLWGTNLAEAHNQHRLAQQYRSQGPSQPTLPGDVLAIITIPKLSLQKYVVEGTEDADLQRGPGHYDGTPMPGQAGNVAIAGHRTTYGAPFYNLDRLTSGDQVVLDTRSHDHFVYTVISQKVVPPDDVSVVQTRPPGLDVSGPHPGYLLTLTTCTPRFSAAQRLVVFAELSNSPAAPAGTPPSGSPPAGRLPAGAGEGVSPGDTGARAAAPATPSLLSGSSRAIPDTVGWGLGAAGLAVITWVCARMWRRKQGKGRGLPVYAVAAAPSLVLLYFFFENVTRLLPANY